MIFFYTESWDINSQLLVIKSELRFIKSELRDINSHRETMFSELRVYLTIIRLLLTRNCEFISHNSEKKSNCALGKACQWCDPFVFISIGLKITFHLFGFMSRGIQYNYSQCWNAVLCNNVLVVSSSSHPEVSRENDSPQNTYKYSSF